jgi:hypothetical protein
MFPRPRVLAGSVAAAFVTAGLLLSPAPAFAATPTCTPNTVAPTNGLPGSVVMANNFESGNLSGFTVKTAGTGTASVSSALAHSGSCSAHLHATADAGSLATASVGLPTGTSTVSADGWFNITTAGVAGNDVPYFRFFSAGTRFLDVYRYNSNGQLWLRVLSSSGTNLYTRLRWQNIPLNSWHHVVVSVHAQGSTTAAQVWFDGAIVYSGSQASTFVSTVTAVQLGAEHARQMGDAYIDDLVVRSAAQ